MKFERNHQNLFLLKFYVPNYYKSCIAQATNTKAMTPLCVSKIISNPGILTLLHSL